MNLEELLAEAKEREEHYPDGMYLALYREQMLDSQAIEILVSGRE